MRARRRIFAAEWPRDFPRLAPPMPRAPPISTSPVRIPPGDTPRAGASRRRAARSGSSPARRLFRAPVIGYSRRMVAARTWFEGEWRDGAPRVQGALSQSFMHGTTVFDGARAFSRQAPDLDLHMARLLRSAEAMGLETDLRETALVDLAIDGIRLFPPEAELYVRPALWAEEGFLTPEGRARFALTLFEAPMPAPSGLSVCLSPFRRPNPDMAPTLAKASCLYPNTALALRDAARRGFDNAIVRDGAGNVVEFGTSNLWLGKDGAAITPEPNGTFLAGVTRRRVIALLGEAGIETRERPVSWEDVLEADEVFSTGNLGKVLPVTRVEDRRLQPGPIHAAAREGYFAWAAGQAV